MKFQAKEYTFTTSGWLGQSAGIPQSLPTTPVTDYGWTSLTKPDEGQYVYVCSATGSDSNDGLTEDTPKKTISAGYNLLRDNYPDWLMFKRGDSVDGNLGNWTKSGKSASKPMVISYYGTSGNRPILYTGDSPGFFAGKPSGNTRNIAIIGLDFVRTGTNLAEHPEAIKLTSPCRNILVEGCRFTNYTKGIVSDGGEDFTRKHFNIKSKRNVFRDFQDWKTSEHTIGVYAAGTAGLEIEECIFDTIGTDNSTIFRHAIYVDAEGNSIVKIIGNTIRKVSATGMQVRVGGIVKNNLVVECPVGIQLGSYQSSSGNYEAINNVVLDGKDIVPSSGPDLNRRWGVACSFIGSSLIQGNIVAHTGSSTDVNDPGRPIEVNAVADSRCFGLLFENNIVYNWAAIGLINFEGYASGNFGTILNNNKFRTSSTAYVLRANEHTTVSSEITSYNNSFYSNAASSSWFRSQNNPTSSFHLSSYNAITYDLSSTAAASVSAGFVAPNRDLLGYANAVFGFTSYDQYFDYAADQWKESWDARILASTINAWIRDGFKDR